MITTRSSYISKIANTCISAALVAALCAPGVASAHGQLTTRSATLGSSAIGDTTTVVFRWNADHNGTAKAIRVEVCTSPTYASPCVKPAGAGFGSTGLVSVGGALTPGWSYSSTVGQITLLKPSGDYAPSSSMSTVTIDNYTNPTVVGTYYFRVTTYSQTSMLNSSELDFGAEAVSTARVLTSVVTQKGTLVFRVANQVDSDCGGQTDIIDPTDSSSDFVTLAPNPAKLDASSIGTAQFCVAENANYGYTVTYRDFALGGAEKGFNNGIHEFDTGGANGTVSQFTTTPGTEQFGFNLRANTIPTFGANPDVSGALSDLTNSDYSTQNRYSYDDSGSSVMLVSRGGVVTSARYTMAFVASIAKTTPGGTYMAHQVLTCTANF